MKFEEIVRDQIKECVNNFPLIYDEIEEIEDYLHLFNYCTTYEEDRIREIFNEMRKLQDELLKIQDDCWGR